MIESESDEFSLDILSDAVELGTFYMRIRFVR